MKKFYYAYMIAETGERFELCDDSENVVVVSAETADDAERKMHGYFDINIDDYMSPVEIKDFEGFREKFPYIAMIGDDDTI